MLLSHLLTHSLPYLSSSILRVPLFSISTYPQCTFPWTSVNKHSLSVYARLSLCTRVPTTSNDTPLPKVWYLACRAKARGVLCTVPIETLNHQTCLLFWFFTSTHALSLIPIFQSLVKCNPSYKPTGILKLLFLWYFSRCAAHVRAPQHKKPLH